MEGIKALSAQKGRKASIKANPPQTKRPRSVCVLREAEEIYGPVFGTKNESIASENALLWGVFSVNTGRYPGSTLAPRVLRTCMNEVVCIDIHHTKYNLHKRGLLWIMRNIFMIRCGK